MRRRWPLLRATAELLNAANGVRPLGREGYITIPVFAFGWPTTEMSSLYLTGSVLDAVRRVCAATSAVPAAESPWCSPPSRGRCWG